jgi:probable HAF family extracellular repeat protein
VEIVVRSSENMPPMGSPTAFSTAAVFTTIDHPLGAGFNTELWGINDAGQIVGSYQNAMGWHAFLYSGGTYTSLDDPSATSGAAR